MIRVGCRCVELAGIDTLGAAPPSFLVLDMSATHGSYEGTHVSASRQPIKSFVYTSKRLPSLRIWRQVMSRGPYSSRAFLLQDREFQAKTSCNQSNPARYSRSRGASCAPKKSRPRITGETEIAVLSYYLCCFRLVEAVAAQSALVHSDARPSSYPTPGLPYPDYTPTF